MARSSIKLDTLRALFARSGNQCAFPGCAHKLVNDHNAFIAQVCHIAAANKGGERFNPDSNDEYRRSYENLILLCYAHHVETDDVGRFPVDTVRQMKCDHERTFEKSSFTVDEAVLYKLKFQMAKYWQSIDRANSLEHLYRDTGLSMEVKGNASFFEVIQSVHSVVAGIRDQLQVLQKSDDRLLEDLEGILKKCGVDPAFIDSIPFYDNPLNNRNWEFHNIGSANLLLRIEIDLVHLEIKYLEEYLLTNVGDAEAKRRLEELKLVLANFASSAMYVD
jgi:hypothetical protein